MDESAKNAKIARIAEIAVIAEAAKIAKVAKIARIAEIAVIVEAAKIAKVAETEIVRLLKPFKIWVFFKKIHWSSFSLKVAKSLQNVYQMVFFPKINFFT